MGTVSIPADIVEAGISRCLNRVRDHLHDARVLTEPTTTTQGTFQNAATFVILAVEETDKAIVLRERSEKQVGEKFVKVDSALFKSHPYKLSEAFKILGPQYARLHKAAFDPKTFSSDYDIFDTNISSDAREALMYIDFDEKSNEWSHTPTVDPERLRKLMKITVEVMESEETLQEERTKKIGNRLTMKKWVGPQSALARP